MTQGRHSTYTQETADAICERIANGRSLRSICKDDDMPDQTTVFRWLGDEKNEDFRKQYARARESQADMLADEILHIADNTEEGTVKIEKPGGTEIKTGDMIEHRRLKVDARKWYASKVAPKKYGDKLATTLTGADDGPIKVEDANAAREALLRGITAATPAGRSNGEGEGSQ